MTESEFLEQVDIWALGGLSDIERAQMEQFLTQHPSAGIQEAYRRAFRTAALLGASLEPVPASDDVWQRIEAALPAPKTGASNGVSTVTPIRKPRRWLAAGWAIAAAAAVLVLWLILDRSRASDREIALQEQFREAQIALAAQRGDVLAAAGVQERLGSCERDLLELRERDALASEAVALLELPGTQLIPLERKTGVSDLAANAVYHRGVKRAYVVVAGLPKTSTAQYQVWLVRSGQRLAAGTAVAGADGRAIARVPTLTLDDGVPETFQLALSTGEIVLESKIRI